MTNPAQIRSFAEPAVDLKGASVLVTGGTGSFGKHFVARLLAEHAPERVIVFSRDELKQHDMSSEARFDHPAVRFFIGDVRDVDRLEMAMRDVDVVVHAAALKQVPTAEYNPFECIRTNVHGAENVVGAAIRTGVPRVIALSTDKAANPINLYGASKLASDKIFVAANNLAGSAKARFSVVRYGNVVGSRGSIVPVFRRLLAEGAESIPITDERMTRFWITLDQAVSFVLSSLAQMRGGELFVPKIPSMKVVDLAAVLAPDLPTRIIGIRPGEKLHEVLITDNEARNTLELDDRFIVTPAFHFWTENGSAPAEGRPVAEEFCYASDTNPEWLSPGNLGAILDETD